MKSLWRQEKSSSPHNKSIAVAILPKSIPTIAGLEKSIPIQRIHSSDLLETTWPQKKKTKTTKPELNLNFTLFPASLGDLAVFFYIKTLLGKKIRQISSEYP